MRREESCLSGILEAPFSLALETMEIETRGNLFLAFDTTKETGLDSLELLFGATSQQQIP